MFLAMKLNQQTDQWHVWTEMQLFGALLKVDIDMLQMCWSKMCTWNTNMCILCCNKNAMNSCPYELLCYMNKQKILVWILQCYQNVKCKRECNHIKNVTQYKQCSLPLPFTWSKLVAKSLSWTNTLMKGSIPLNIH